MRSRLFVKVLIGLIALAINPLPLGAAVTVAGVFGDNMVLQADQPVKVWGWANPGEQVKVAVDDLSGDATTGADGGWVVTLGSHKPGGPYDLTINGDFKKISNVMFGNVWLCAGQSNMAFATKDVKDAAKELADANYPSIRFCHVKWDITASPKKDVGATWQVCTPETAANNTAVGFSSPGILPRSIRGRSGWSMFRWAALASRASFEGRRLPRRP